MKKTPVRRTALLTHGIAPNANVRIDVASRDGLTGIFAISSRLEAF